MTTDKSVRSFLQGKGLLPPNTREVWTTPHRLEITPTLNLTEAWCSCGNYRSSLKGTGDRVVKLLAVMHELHATLEIETELADLTRKLGME